MEPTIADKPVPREIRSLLSDERVILHGAQHAMTPFGGVAVFLSILLLFNLLAEFERAVVWMGCREPATIRTHVWR